MATRILAFECDFCGKICRTKNLVIRHEKACLKNPRGQNCLNCSHSFQTEDLTMKCGVKGKRCSKSLSGNCEEYKEKEGGKVYGQ